MMAGVDLLYGSLADAIRFLSMDKKTLKSRDIYINLRVSPHGETLLNRVE